MDISKNTTGFEGFEWLVELEASAIFERLVPVLRNSHRLRFFTRVGWCTYKITLFYSAIFFLFGNCEFYYKNLSKNINKNINIILECGPDKQHVEKEWRTSYASNGGGVGKKRCMNNPRAFGFIQSCMWDSISWKLVFYSTKSTKNTWGKC